MTPTIEAEVMTQLKALKLASKAIDYLLTGEPALDTFDPSEINAAFDLLVAQRWARRGQRQNPDKVTLLTAQVSLHKVYWRILQQKGEAGVFSRSGKGGKQRPHLEAARTALPEIIAQSEADYSAYWQAFTQDALAEVDAILGGGQ